MAHDHDGEHGGDDHDGDHGDHGDTDLAPSLPRALLTRRVPLWALLAAVVVVAAVLGAVVVLERRASVDLGPAVGVAERVEVEMTLCNEEVDRLELNPRRAELDLEEVLREEGATAAQVRVERRDCPRPQ